MTMLIYGVAIGLIVTLLVVAICGEITRKYRLKYFEGLGREMAEGFISDLEDRIQEERGPCPESMAFREVKEDLCPRCRGLIEQTIKEHTE